ncbi:hypothetical protein FNH13_10290 [Ornithinimicrobium ciconiae]|uniref:Uncharacterized protein n=1 Tax=Ornithinimicrobium ciconiae TaxID=2594265 RepID=A0A516GB03_9MICO|nr:hypothetical protein [Ornithinimicrobium ciconiae]QDO88672.1 hypothetical protein FNH13_10290 [Ornithinimicrobium ciconiae]
MQWYAETPARRTRQVIADLVVLAWVVLWVLVGRWIYSLVSALSAPADPLRTAGQRVQTRAEEIATTIGDTPLVGDRLTGPFEGVASAGGSLVTAGDSLESAVHRVATLVGTLTALVPIVLVVAAYLLVRVVAARRAGALARFRDSEGALDLLALRALVNQKPTRLAAVGADPLSGWRSGDQEQISALAAMELRRVGLRPTPLSRT